MANRTLHTLFIAIYFILSLFVLAHFLNNALLGDRYSKAHHFHALYEGTASKPYVYRVLIPTITRAVVAITPHSLQEAVSDMVTPKKKTVFPDRESAYPRLVVIMLVYASLLGYVAFLRALSIEIFPDNPAIHYFAPIVALAVLPAFSWPLQYIYDFPVLLLSAGCYYYLFMRRFDWYLPLFILACLNKESSIFIVAFFIIWFYRRLDQTQYIRLITLQILAYVLIQGSIRIIYQDNVDWFSNHPYAAPLYDWLSRMPIDGAINIAVLFFLFTYRWLEKPVFLKTILWVLPMMVAAFLLVGRQKEYRVFFDIMPLLVLLATHTLVEAAGFSKLEHFRKKRGGG